MKQIDIDNIIESLRKGIPPDCHIEDFTVGRQSEIDQLQNILKIGGEKAFLVKANYGSGKTHLLKLIREMALANDYAVSLITIEAQSNVRFNRMDQIFGQICRRLEIPRISGKSVRYLFDAVSLSCSQSQQSKHNSKDVLKLTNNGLWDYSSFLSSPALYVAIRAWFFGQEELKNRIEDWLFHPWQYYSQRKDLYIKLVQNLRKKFRDPRPDWKFYSDEVFLFRTQAYRQSWDAINDLDKISKIIGLRGLILLVDEFEDVIYNLRNKAHQQSAFWNLFHFFSGDIFNNLSFFAVTPGFVEKCKEVLLKKRVWDYDYSRFDKLKSFEMSPISDKHLFTLGKKIVPIHFAIYNWSRNDKEIEMELREIVRDGMQLQVQDRVRQTIKSIVMMLDSMMEKTDDG